jgi:hypothetical protein
MTVQFAMITVQKSVITAQKLVVTMNHRVRAQATDLFNGQNRTNMAATLHNVEIALKWKNFISHNTKSEVHSFDCLWYY